MTSATARSGSATSDAPVDPPAEARRPGRPRDPQADAAILQATVEVLCEHGFGAFTVDAVAAHAGVGKATIYRRWPSREALVLDAAATLVPQPDVPDTGSVRDDLIALMSGSFEDAASASKQQLMAAVTAEAVVNPEMKRLLRDYTQRRRDGSAVVVRRAIERGELPADTDPDFLLDLIAGPLFYRVQISGRPIGPQVVADVVDVVLGGLAR
jgi:AcrR family transcriptional regulator